MIAAVCIDDGNGMLFNRRRQSRDAAQQADLLNLCGDGNLWITPFSASLFASQPDRVRVTENPGQVPEGAVFFAENQPLQPLLERVEAVILYRWNRAYPADVRLDIDVADGFILRERVEFPGKSHEVITREYYERSK